MRDITKQLAFECPRCVMETDCNETGKKGICDERFYELPNPREEKLKHVPDVACHVK